MASYQDYGKMQEAYFAANPYKGPPASYSSGQTEGGYWPVDDAAAAAFADYNSKTGEAWLKSLTPAQRAEFDAYHQQAVAANAKKARNGALLAVGAPLLAAGAGALMGPGGFGSLGAGAGAGAGSGAGGFIFNPAVDSQLASIAGGFSGLGGASIPTGVNLGSLGGVMGTGLTTGGALAGDVLKMIGGGAGDIVNKVGDVLAGPGTGGKSGINWGSLLGGAGLGAGALAAIQALQNRGNMPALPDFTKLAEQTAKSQNDAVNAQTLANRPNQINAQGDTSTWTLGPDGRPVQKTQFGTANQQAFDQNSQTLAALRSQMTANAGQPLNAPTMGSAMANALRTKRVI